MELFETTLAYIRQTYATSHPHLKITETGEIKPIHTTPDVMWDTSPLTEAATTGTVLLADERTN